MNDLTTAHSIRYVYTVYTYNIRSFRYASASLVTQTKCTFIVWWEIFFSFYTEILRLNEIFTHGNSIQKFMVLFDGYNDETVTRFIVESV